MPTLPRPTPDRFAAARARTRALGDTFPLQSIGSAVSEACARYPDRMAIEVFERGERATFAAFEALTHRYAQALTRMGIAKGDRVGLMLPNRLAYPALFIALARLGAVHVPVNTRYTADEIAYVLGDSGARLLLHDGQFAKVVAGLPEDLRRRLAVADIAEGDGAFDRIAAASPETPLASGPAGPDDLANIQYTSGTTGFPKGCMLTHDYWLVLARAALAWDAAPAGRILSAQPYFYMDPQWITLKALLSGATLVIAPGLSSSRFLGWLIDHNIEWCMFPLLMTRQPERPEEAQTALKQVATFGWPPETCRDFRRRFGVTAREAFGMTEIGLGTWMPPELDEMYASGSVGFAAPCRETTIRNEAGAPVATGETGELWVRGRSIFQGYWNRPEANAEAFREGRWFRTGDLFRKDADGFLYLVGRLKDMIRRSQENIAAREVEAVICALPGIEDAAAVPVPDPVRGEEVKLYVQLKPGTRRDAMPVELILDHARAHLAKFKVPRYLAYVEGFPRTPSNKIEKKALLAGVDDLRFGAFDAVEGIWR
ncbi:class I adenylate-forming enzyme family protein [Acidimangrovimonas pyrenivorans]|uniref:Class I adenylate-forming enzyme family protein n=1 Tax=Acidimangrovimonas pyrenivorans TaxID=2030798 RepID=A0ABV7AEG0_9RHOB